MYSHFGGCQCLQRNTSSSLGWCLRLKKAWDILGGSEETPGRPQAILEDGFPHDSSEGVSPQGSSAQAVLWEADSKMGPPHPAQLDHGVPAPGLSLTAVSRGHGSQKTVPGWERAGSLRTGQSSPTAGLRHGTLAAQPAWPLPTAHTHPRDTTLGSSEQALF